MAKSEFVLPDGLELELESPTSPAAPARPRPDAQPEPRADIKAQLAGFEIELESPFDEPDVEEPPLAEGTWVDVSLDDDDEGRRQAFYFAASCSVESAISTIDGSRHWQRHASAILDDVRGIHAEAEALALGDIGRLAGEAIEALTAIDAASPQRCTTALRALSQLLQDQLPSF